MQEEYILNQSCLFSAEETSNLRLYSSFDMWGSCRPKNILKCIRINAVVKPLLLALLKRVLCVCETADLPVFGYAGTALGMYRENGHMLMHDYDIDLAVSEYLECGQGSLSMLANACSRSNVLIEGVDKLKSPAISSNSPPHIKANFGCSFTSTKWVYFNDEAKEQFGECPFNGNGGKRAKFTFTEYGFLEAVNELNYLKSNNLKLLLQNLSSLHVDLFTLSPHPDSPELHLRVNWHHSVLYNSLLKMFPRDSIYPLRSLRFEEIPLNAPADLKRYLEIEYNYIGRDAFYDSTKQHYVKMSETSFSSFPPRVQKLFR